MLNKFRLDKILVTRGIVENSNKAKALIMAGKIIVNGKKIEKSGLKFLDDIDIRVLTKGHQWVSRGGVKLAEAVKSFKIDLENKICIDIGASTGGFTDVLLQNKAKHIYCVDVGRGQLDWKLRKNEKITVMDKTNIRNISLEEVDKSIEVITCDLSFISIQKALEKIIQFNKNNLTLIVLVKPQFELSRDKVRKNGIVTNAQYRDEAVENTRNWLMLNNWNIIDQKQSIIKGTKGNIEYFIYAIKD